MRDALHRLMTWLYWTWWLRFRWDPVSLGDVTDYGDSEESVDKRD